MKKYLAVVWCAVIVTGTIAGCRSAALPEEGTELREECELGEKIIQAVADKDFSDYLHCSGDGAVAVDEQNFLRSCSEMEKNFGKINRIAFLTRLESPEFINLVYVADFTRERSRGGTIRHQQLIQLLLGKVDGRYKLMGIRIM